MNAEKAVKNRDVNRKKPHSSSPLLPRENNQDHDTMETIYRYIYLYIYATTILRNFFFARVTERYIAERASKLTRRAHVIHINI